MYSELVYRIGKRYSAERQLTDAEFPAFSGTIADLIGDDHDLALQGEKIIAYNDDKGARHLIRVYFEDGTFEAQGTPAEPGLFSMSMDSGVGRDE